MKKAAVLAFGICMLITSGVLSAQESKFGKDSIQTLKNASIYTELWNQKNFRDALPAWRYIFLNAPAFQQNTYIRGEDIIEYMLMETKKKEYLDTLMMVYDQRIKYFGQDPRFGEGFVLGRKGIALLNHGDGTPETLKKAYDYLSRSIEMKGAKSHPAVIDRLMVVACDLAQTNDLSPEMVIDLYGKLSAIAKANIDEGGRMAPAFTQCKGNLDAIFFSSGLASCETLSGLMMAKYEANKENLEELKGIASLLTRRECTELPVYTMVVEEIYRLEPSAEAAQGLARMFIRKDQGKAEKYLKEAVEKAGDDQKIKEDSYMMLIFISMSQKNYPLVKKYALEAIKINPNSGKAYMAIGRAYAFGSKNYDEDEFKQRTVFWAAVDKFEKAKQVDPSVEADANALIKDYTLQFPPHGEAFFNSITPGDKVHIGGWINEDTVARFREE